MTVLNIPNGAHNFEGSCDESGEAISFADIPDGDFVVDLTIRPTSQNTMQYKASSVSGWSPVGSGVTFEGIEFDPSKTNYIPRVRAIAGQGTAGYTYVFSVKIGAGNS